MTGKTDKRLYIVTVEFEFPAMLTADEAESLSISGLVRDALRDLGDVPATVDPAAPTYFKPHGYDDETLVYGADGDVTWAEAVAEDKAIAQEGV